MAEPDPQRPKVVYVVGAHRSGSTVLGVTLGNCDGVFFAGELHSWLTRRGVPSFGGEQGAQLWQAIAEEVPNAHELFGHETQLTLDRSSVIYRPQKWPRRRRLRGSYRRIYEDLYRAIARQTGASSRYVLYGDTLGPEGSDGATYVQSEIHNADAMVRGFTGGERGCSIGVR